jgi:hypothetical protein
MSEIRTLLERKQTELHAPAGSFERLILRRDRKRRNQRIAAGVVGIAVFVAAIWIVTTGLSLDRTETPADPGETGPAVPAQAGEPDVVRGGPCSGESRWRLELTDEGDRIKVRFEVHNSLDHRWRVVLRHGRAGPDGFDHGDGRVFYDGIKSAVFLWTGFEVQRRVVDHPEVDDGFAAKAVDQRTGQLCHVHTRIR